MYQQFFNFNTAPFSIAPDPHFIYMSEHHQEGLAHLLYGINHGGGFVALTGEVGTGKTTLCHCLLQQLPDNIDIALLLNPKLNAIELLATICDELHIAYDRQLQSLKSLVDQLNTHLLAAHANGRRTVLVIDEAQNLSFNVLEQIRLLTNLETSSSKLLQIILLGQPELKLILEKPALRQLNQRITARYHLTSLSYADTQHYIHHRLKLCGGNKDIFNRRAIKKIFSLSKGIPRLINILCDRALLGAYVNDTHWVNLKIIKQAAKEVLSPAKSSTKFSLSAVLQLSFLFLMAIGISYYLTPQQSQSEHVILTGSFEKPTEQPVLAKTISLIEAEPSAVEAVTFNQLLQQHPMTLAMLFPQLSRLWDNNPALGTGCKEIERTGLYCLFDQSDWNSLKALNRPVIMEFESSESSESSKTYALLIGLKQGQPIFLFNKETTVPLQQVLKQWNGYYLMLWQAPIQSISEIYPGTSSAAVLWLRKHFAMNKELTTVEASVFDDVLKKAVIAFQNKNHLSPDGIVGPRTFIQLNNTDPLNTSPKLRLID